jgi:hypothetical protein
MSGERTELNEAVEEVRTTRRAISAEFDHDPHKYYEYLVEYQKQFGNRLVTRGNKSAAWDFAEASVHGHCLERGQPP